MPEYLAPGVYVEETSFRSKSIEGVSTTTTGFIGPTRYGPVTLTPDVVTSLGEFERIYAGGGQLEFLDRAGKDFRDKDDHPLGESDNLIWHAGRAFFIEGGKRLYICRVFRPLAIPSKPNEEPTYPLDPADGKESYDYGQGPIYVDGHSRDERNSVEVRSRFPGAASVMVATLTLQAGQNVLRAEMVGATDQSSLSPPSPEYHPKLGALADRDVVYLDPGTASPLGPGQKGFYLAEYDAMKEEWSFTNDASGLVVRLETLTASPEPQEGDSIYPITLTVNVQSDDREHDLGTWSNLPLDPGHQRFGVPDSVFAKFAARPASDADARQLPVVFSKLAEGTTGLKVLEDLFGSPLKSFPLDAEVERRDANLSDLQRMQKGSINGTFNLIGGNDGQRPGAADYEGRDVIDQNPFTGAPFKTGLNQFEDIEDISIVAAPAAMANYENFRDDANAITRFLIAHTEKMRYRIAVLDSPPGAGISDVRKVRAKLDSKYAALYYPWVTVLDPITRKELNLPPSGFVSGIYARNDIQRAVWKAPANEVVNLAIGFEQWLNKAQQEVLNPEGINCFRFFEGRGFRLWGARTISSDPEWKYVNLRRYFAYLEHSIDKGTQWAVFEPNGYALWANVRRTIEDFLLNEFQMGALLGEKPEQAYFVKCDRSTMTQNDLDNGRLVALIGVAPLRPAEFVIFRIGQWTADRRN